MSDTALPSETSGESGLLTADRLSEALRITRGELAVALGLERDSFTKASRARNPATQKRLRDMVEILNRVRPWAGTLPLAFAWYRSQTLPSFGD